jgi:hypothetical protein
MNAILEPAVFRRAHDLTPEPSVALVTGGAVLGFDDQVHIDLDRAHTVLSPDEARRFAAELKRIADAIRSIPCRAGGAAARGSVSATARPSACGWRAIRSRKSPEACLKCPKVTKCDPSKHVFGEIAHAAGEIWLCP